MNSQPIERSQVSRSSTKKNRNRILLSCTECHRRKQRCSRYYPCSDCVERGVPHKCVFEKPIKQRMTALEINNTKDARMRRIIMGEEVLLTPESVADLQRSKSLATNTITHTTSREDMQFPTHPVRIDMDYRPILEVGISSAASPWSHLGGYDPFSAMPERSGEPIHKAILINYFLQILAPWLGHYDDDQASNSQAYSWLPYALHHPPLFYATLLCAAVHLDRWQPMDTRILLWYKIETMSLANEKLGRPNEGNTDQMLLVVLVLLYFNVGGGDAVEYETHLAGINQMLVLRGGMSQLGMRGMVKNWLDICYGPWSKHWQYGLFADFLGIKRETRREHLFRKDHCEKASELIVL